MTTAEKIVKIEQLRKEGIKVADACKQVGLSNPSYYANRNKRKGKHKKVAKPRLQHISMNLDPQINVKLLDVAFELMKIARGE